MQAQITPKTESKQTLYIGLDVHKNSWKVTILGEYMEHKQMSMNSDPVELANYLNRQFPESHYVSVYEAGFCGFSVHRDLVKLGIDSKVIHPADVPSSSKERTFKTDKSDSRKLAHMLRAQVLKPIYIPSEHLEADRDLLRQRNRLVKDLTRVKNRVKSILMTKGIDIPEVHAKGSQVWSKRFLTWLKQVDMGIDEFKSVLHNFIEHGEFLRVQVLKLNRQVRALSTNARYKCNAELAFSIPGIGLITGMTLLTELGPIERFAHLDQLCSYVGLIPTMHNSGNKVSVGEMTHRGRKVLKVMVIEASWMAVRYDPALHQRYEALRKQGMTANKAIIRIAKKLLNRFRHVALTQTPYQIGVVQ